MFGLFATVDELPRHFPFDPVLGSELDLFIRYLRDWPPRFVCALAITNQVDFTGERRLYRTSETFTVVTDKLTHNTWLLMSRMNQVKRGMPPVTEIELVLHIACSEPQRKKYDAVLMSRETWELRNAYINAFPV